MFGRRRISAFARGFYGTGLLGRFIGVSHGLSRLLGVNVSKLTNAATLDEQRKIFDESISPLFDHWFLRWIVRHPRLAVRSWHTAGAKYAALAGNRDDRASWRVAATGREACLRLSHQGELFCPSGFRTPVRSGLQRRRTAIPGRAEFFGHTVADRSPRRPACLSDRRAGQGAIKSVHCIVLLDAQDWMNDQQLTALWRQINHCAAAGRAGHLSHRCERASAAGACAAGYSVGLALCRGKKRGPPCA